MFLYSGCYTYTSYMSNSKYVNIEVDKTNYEDLKVLGEVPESFNDVISRLLKEKQPIIKAIRAAKENQE
jgi:predicted CopG family antitoxin